jgi:hypothetical protein
VYYKKFAKITCLSISVLFFIPIIIIIAIDPLQVFHKSWFFPGKYYAKSMREATYGIIKYENFDSIIVGSSMANNFSANEASQKLGGNFINLTINGSTLIERKILFKHLFSVKRPKIMICSFDELVDIGFINNYDKLYGSFFDKLSFYHNNRLIGLIKEVIIDKSNLIDDLDQPEAWYNLPEQKCRFGGFDKWIDAAVKGNLQAKYSLKSIIDATRKDKINSAKPQLNCGQIDDCLIDFCKRNTHTTFIIFLPPYHKVCWKTEAVLSNKLELYYTRIRYLLKKSKKYKNIIVFGFDNDSFTTDISRYKDRAHYDEKINSYILDCIRDKTHILTSENIDEYFRKMEKDIQDYDLKPFYDQIKDLDL